MSTGMDSLSISQLALIITVFIGFITAIYGSCCNPDSFKCWAKPRFNWATRYFGLMFKVGFAGVVTPLVGALAFGGSEALYLIASISILVLAVAYLGLELKLLDEADLN